MIDFNDLLTRFSHHKPDDEAAEKMQMIRNIALSYSSVINEYLPDGREKSSAITKLEEVVFWANAGIARHNAATTVSE